MGFFSELRQRRLFQIVVSYIAAGWVALNVVDQFVDRGLLPEILYFILLIWYLTGVPAALLVGWNHGEKGVQKAPRSEVVLLACLAVIALGISGFTVDRMRAAVPAASTVNLKRIAVVYFQDTSSDGANQHLADALTEDLIDELSRVPGLEVISQNGVRPFRGEQLPPEEVAARLEAGTVVDGTIEQSGDGIRVNLVLRDGQSGAAFQRAAIQRPAAELLSARDEVVGEAASLLRQFLGEEIAVRSRAEETSSVEAWALVQRAQKTRKDADDLLQHDPDAARQNLVRADSLLARAETLDSVWVEPIALRSDVAYQLARLVLTDPPRASQQLDVAITLADRAVRRNERSASAHLMLGTAAYQKYLLNVTPDPAAQAALLERGRRGLERAVELDPMLAIGFSRLSHLYYNQGDVPAGVSAARQAYEVDAYLDSVDQVLFRLYTGNFDLGNLTEASRWCTEGGGRFEHDYRFTLCALELLATPALEPDTLRARMLAARLDSLAPEPRREVEQIRGQMLLGGVLGRAGLRDRADVLLTGARDRIPLHSEFGHTLVWLEAQMRTVMGDQEGAIDILRREIATNPEHAFKPGGNIAWYWRDLQGNPRFRELVQR